MSLTQVATHLDAEPVISWKIITVVETVLEKLSCLCLLYGEISFASETDLF